MLDGNIESSASSTSTISDCFTDQNVLLTGASGALGKLVLEKLLRCCRCKTIYILVRAKKGKSPDQRFEQILQAKCFDRVRDNGDACKAIRIIEADMMQLKLGLNEPDIGELQANVTVVLHLAATVRFNEALDTATLINVRGTRELVSLAKQMKCLKVFTYVSTAFCYTPRRQIDEKIYNSPISPADIITLSEILERPQLDHLTPKLVGEWPNTYVYTKAITENLLLNEKHCLPIVIVRPAQIISCMKEPIPGYIDNIYGIVGMSVATFLGLIQIQYGDNSKYVEMVPADFVVNLTLTATWKRAILGTEFDQLPIYNFVASVRNPIKMGEFKRIMLDVAHRLPSKKALWTVSGHATTSHFWFTVLTFLMHTLPAHLIDTLLWLKGDKPIAVHNFRKLNQILALLYVFVAGQWLYSDTNVEALWNELSSADKLNYNFDMRSINWNTFLNEGSKGARYYLLQETDADVPSGRKRRFFIYTLQYTLISLLIIFVVYGTLKLIKL